MKVLVPLDGSEVTRSAMERGLALLDGCDKEVTLLCVRAKGFEDVDDDRREIFEENPDDEIFASDHEAQEMLDQAAATCKENGVDASTQILVGNFAKVILEESTKHDLVVIHALGKEPLKEKLRMSKAESLVRSFECAVLLA